jgi:Reverse transcriptase (RNA-dependent DNA polymerase)
MNVKSIFFNGVLEEEVCVEQPFGYKKSEKKHKMLKLNKILYGLEHAQRAWNIKIDGYFKENDFKQYPYEHTIYMKSRRGEILIVTLYVDDLIFMRKYPRMVEEFKRVMMKEFKMTYLRLMIYILGLEVKKH